MKKIFILLSALIFGVFSHAQYKYLKGTLTAAQEGPTVSSFASGVVIVRYNTVTRLVEHFGNYRGLTANITNQHIHTGAPGVSGPPTVQLASTGGTAGNLTGSQVLTVAQEADLLAGNMYTNVHTSTYTGGEIRAQLTLTTDGQTEHLNGRLQGAQSTPPNASTATGNVNVLIDKATHTLYLTGTYTGLTTAANNAHIHVGAPLASGGVIVPLNFVTATSGSLDTSLVITTTNEASILSGGTYVNIHTPTYSDGEIRGQLLLATGLRYLAGALQGSQETQQPNTSAGRGTVIVRYNTQTNLLELTGDYQNLSAAISGSHIHGPAAPGADAGILFNLNNQGGTMGTLTGNFTLTEPQEVDLLAGNTYVNVHSTGTYSAGEIRAQLLPLSSGETEYLTAGLDVDEERAAFPSSTITSSGVGTAVVVLDKITKNIYLTGSYSNLSAGISNAHIHRGPVAVSGPVSIQLQYIATNTSGTVTGSATNIRTTLMDSILSGNTYVNIHSSVYTTGEIRGQLGNIVLPVKLKYFNGYKEQNKIALIWETEQQINLDRYEIEQQNPETGKWITKSSVNAAGGSALVKLKFTDVPTNYKSAYVIYRLKMIDKDGKFSYSSSVKINYKDAKAELMVIGNPIVNGELNYMITGLAADSKTEVSVIDYSGKVVLRTRGQALMNNRVNISRLSAGVYKLVVKFNESILQQNFIK